MNDKLIIFNGPPGSGKDEAVRFLDEFAQEERGVRITVPMMFKERLYKLASVVYALSYDEVVEYCTDRKLKETPCDAFWGLSPRQAIIRVSEECMKPVYGKDYFGKVCVADMIKTNIVIPCNKTFLFSDGGFPDEVNQVINHVGSENALIVRIYRDGHDFSNDSRRYLEETDLPIGTSIREIENNGSLLGFHQETLRVTEDFLYD